MARSSSSRGGSSRSGPAVDLDRRAELLAGGEHVVGVERRRRPLADHPAGAVAEDVDVRVGDGQHHPLGHLLALHAQLGVHAGDDDVEALEQVVVEVERAVLEDVDLHPGEDPEVVVERGVELGDVVELALAAAPGRARGRSSGGPSGRSAPCTRGRAPIAVAAISSISAPPSLHVECRWQSPRSASR